MTIPASIPAPASQALAHPVWTVITIGVAFAALMLIDSVVAVLTGRSLLDRVRSLVAMIVAPIGRFAPPPPNAAPAMAEAA